MEALQIQAAIQISKPKNEVFGAIVDPEKMSKYFIAESTGRMEEGKTIKWKFPEFEQWAQVKIVQVVPHEYISFLWEGPENQDLLVEFTFLDVEGDSCLLKITEGKMETNEAGIKWLTQNSEGWANFLACLKAYMEYGINLRKGAFDFMKQP